MFGRTHVCALILAVLTVAGATLLALAGAISDVVVVGVAAVSVGLVAIPVAWAGTVHLIAWLLVSKLVSAKHLVERWGDRGKPTRRLMLWEVASLLARQVESEEATAVGRELMAYLRGLE